METFCITAISYLGWYWSSNFRNRTFNEDLLELENFVFEGHNHRHEIIRNSEQQAQYDRAVEDLMIMRNIVHCKESESADDIARKEEFVRRLNNAKGEHPQEILRGYAQSLGFNPHLCSAKILNNNYSKFRGHLFVALQGHAFILARRGWIFKKWEAL